jgi:hypothetical protein
MSSFKRITPSDIIISPYVANKTWGFSYDNYVENGINVYTGINYTSSFTLNSPTSSGQYNQLVYDSINHLYYQSYSGSLLDSGSLISSIYYEDAQNMGRPSGSYYNYLDTTFGVKTFPSGSDAEIRVISIPKEKYGSKIKPGSFNLIAVDYSAYDDTYGNIIETSAGSYIGNIFYEHGMIIISEVDYLYLTGSQIEFKGEHVIYEQTVKCNIKDYEFNYSFNPTTLNNIEKSEVKAFATGSIFQPYMTSIGLYDDACNLLAIGKFGKPIPISPNTDTTVIIKLDL